MADKTDTGKTTIDAAEVERFSKMATEWWDPSGKFKPLHKFNPVRLAYIDVVGVDPSATNINVATLHAGQSGLAIDYRTTSAEALAAEGETFDVILNMEVVEHVADVPLFLSQCAKMLRPGGLMFVATINRTLKAWGLAIIGAEHVLRWLPKGTHQYEKLVRPEEIKAPLGSEGLSILETQGVFYNLLQDQWQLSGDTDVNYMMLAERPAE